MDLSENMTQIYDGAAIARFIEKIADAIHNEFPVPADPEPALIGIQAGGIPFAQRIAGVLSEKYGRSFPVGILDIAMYRDDFGTGKTLPMIRETSIDFDINRRAIILADDVLHTGRSIRAALDALTDYGRPDLIRLAVLIDRGLREYPIRADYTGEEKNVDPALKIRVHWSEYNQADGVFTVPHTRKA